MKDWKRIGKALLTPPLWLVLLLTVLCTAALTAVFAMGWDTSPAAYAVYVLSFYTLSVLCVFCVKVLPACYRKAKQRVYDNKYGNRYLTDVAFKTHVSLYRSLAINLLYVGTNVFSALWYRSAWSGILAGYYVILAVTRFLLLRFVNRNGIGRDRVSEFRRSRLCGLILMTVNLTLSGAVLMMLYQNRGYEYNGILIYVVAMYTFYVTTHAVVDIVKYRRYNSPIMSAAKGINLSAALVSMLSLETAMLSQFGADMAPQTRRILIAATGAGVSVVVIAMSVYMIVRATKEIKRLQINNS